jgi:hypothetical protein
MVVTVLDRPWCVFEKRMKVLFTLEQRQRHQISSVQKEQIEREVDEVVCTSGVGRRLHIGKRCCAIRPHHAQLAVKIGVPHPDTGECFCSRFIPIGPVQPGSRQQLRLAPRKPRVDAIAVVLDLMRPMTAFWRRFNELRELGRNE